MKHRLLALGLSALTLIGGHFYNRRWDRAVLFFLILMLWGIGVYASLMLSMSRLAVSGSTEAFSAILASHWAALGLGGLLLWVVSLIVTYWDAGRVGEPLAHWTGSAVIAAVGLSLLNGIFMLMLLITGSATTRFSDDVDPDRAEANSGPVGHASTNFSHYVYLGGYPNLREELPKPPDGEGHLRGRFIYEGRAAAGVSFNLSLNGKYETGRLTTDERGGFRLRLPRGEWSVNRLVTREWSDKPEEDGFSFMIVTGEEPKLVGGRYNEHYWFDREGIKIEVGEEPKAPQLTFTIRKRVALTWPGPGETGAPTTVNEGVVAWEPYPAAETYLVRILELVREENSTSSHEVAIHPVTGDTRFPLARLQALPSESGEKEYQASVLAFAQDGQFLSETAQPFQGHTFTLTDNKQFVRESERIPGSNRFSSEELEQMRDNNQRIDAVAVLLKNELPNEAERLLGKVRGKTDPGKKAAVTGYLMAVRDRCAEANRLFAQAQSEGGHTCVPQHYRAGCGK